MINEKDALLINRQYRLFRIARTIADGFNSVYNNPFSYTEKIDRNNRFQYFNFDPKIKKAINKPNPKPYEKEFSDQWESITILILDRFDKELDPVTSRYKMKSTEFYEIADKIGGKYAVTFAKEQRILSFEEVEVIFNSLLEPYLINR